MDRVLKTFLADAAQLGRLPEARVIRSLVSELASDRDYWAHRVDAMGDSQGDLVHWPDEGVRVVIVHRTDGAMSAIHSHECWAALTALRGVETHRHYRTLDGPQSRVALHEERRLVGGSGELVTLIPPDDVHSHGHLRGSGDWPYTLIVLGDAQERFLRYEYDPTTGEPRPLPPGDMGGPNLPPDVAEASPL